MKKYLIRLLLLISICALCFVGCTTGGGGDITPIGGDNSPATIVELSIDNHPSKTAYAYGEDFDPSGISIVARMSDGTEELVPLSDLTIELGDFEDATAEGEYTIRLALKEDATKYVTVTVNISFSELAGITLGNVRKAYDGTAVGITLNGIPADATVKYSTSEDGEYSTVAPTFTDAGSYMVYVRVSRTGYRDFTASAYVNIEALDFSVDDIDVYGYDAVYDGQAHGLTVDSLPQGATITYATDNSADAEYTAVAPTFTDSGKHRVYYRVSAPNTTDFNSYSDVVITPVTLTGISAENVVDMEGEEHSITVIGTETADTITYRTDPEGAWSETSVVASAAGKTTVYYQVVRDQNHTFTGSATITLIPNTEITGILVGRVSKTWTGMSYGITSSDIIGLESGDIVAYSEDGDTWTNSAILYTEPTPADEPYTTYVRVWRPNAGYAVVSAEVSIAKARYAMTVLDNVTREFTIGWRSGLTLADIAEEKSLAEHSLRFDVPTKTVNAGNRIDYKGYYNADPAHYEDLELTIYVTITPAENPAEDFIMADVNVTYDGQPHTVQPTGAKLSEYFIIYYSSDTYTMGISKPSFTEVKPSSYYSIYYTASRDNYKQIKGIAKVTINPANYPTKTHDDITVNYETGMELYDIALDEHFSWTESEATKVTPGVTTREIYYDDEPLGKYNYNPYRVNITLTINPGVLEVSANDLNVVYGDQMNSFGVSGINQETDTLSYSTVGDPYDWRPSSARSEILYECRNVGVHTVYYRVERENYATVIDSVTITVTKATKAFYVEQPENRVYDGTNKTINVVSTAPTDGFTITYSSTSDGDYTTTVPQCILPGEYSFYVKLDSTNYHIKSASNSAVDYVFVEFTVDKGSFSADSPLNPTNMSALKNISEPFSEGETYSFDITPITAALAEIGITDTADYSIEYSTDRGVNYFSAAPVFIEVTDATVAVYIKLETELYTAVYKKTVSLKAISDVSTTVGNTADFDTGVVTGLYAYSLEFSLDNKTSWISEDELIAYVFTEASDVRVYYRVITYVENPEYTNPEDPDDHWEPVRTYIYYFTVTVTEA